MELLFIFMITNFQHLRNKMYDVLFDSLNDFALVLHNNCKYKIKGMFYAPSITPNIGDVNTEIVEPQFIVKAKTLQTLNTQIAPSKLNTNDLLYVYTGDEVIKNELYKIVTIEPDSSGVVVLILRKTNTDDLNNEYYYAE